MNTNSVHDVKLNPHDFMQRPSARNKMMHRSELRLALCVGLQHQTEKSQEDRSHPQPQSRDKKVSYLGLGLCFPSKIPAKVKIFVKKKLVRV